MIKASAQEWDYVLLGAYSNRIARMIRAIRAGQLLTKGEKIMLNHPEQSVQEIFLGNHTTVVARPYRGDARVTSKLNALKTLRLGAVAYDDIHGGTEGMAHMRPLFINRCEYPAYDRIMVQHAV